MRKPLMLLLCYTNNKRDHKHYQLKTCFTIHTETSHSNNHRNISLVIQFIFVYYILLLNPLTPRSGWYSMSQRISLKKNKDGLYASFKINLNEKGVKETFYKPRYIFSEEVLMIVQKFAPRRLLKCMLLPQ